MKTARELIPPSTVYVNNFLKYSISLLNRHYVREVFAGSGQSVAGQFNASPSSAVKPNKSSDQN